MKRGGVFAGLNPPYATIVADPPWDHSEGTPPDSRHPGPKRNRLPYAHMTLDEIRALPVEDLCDAGHLYLWTTNRFLRHAYGVAEAWGFVPRQTLVWCKPVEGCWRPGGVFANSTEFVIFARRDPAPPKERIGRSHWEWPRAAHSAKPAAFGDIVEQVSPGPYLELFARNPRLGWDAWGRGYELGDE